MENLVKRVEKNIQERINLSTYVIELNDKQARNFLDKRLYDVTVKKLETLAMKEAKELTDEPLKFIVEDIFLNLGGKGEPKGVAIIAQARTGKGAVRVRAFIPLKLGSPKVKFMETAGGF